jgi:hypothetical protein
LLILLILLVPLLLLPLLLLLPSGSGCDINGASHAPCALAHAPCPLSYAFCHLAPTLCSSSCPHVAYAPLLLLLLPSGSRCEIRWGVWGRHLVLFHVLPPYAPFCTSPLCALPFPLFILMLMSPCAGPSTLYRFFHAFCPYVHLVFVPATAPPPAPFTFRQ